MHTPLKALTLLASLLAAQTFAQTGTSDQSAARARFQQEMADCAVTNPVVGNRNCVREARNTLAEIQRGRMAESWQPSDFERNTMLRCGVHQGDDKSDCIARMRGHGKIEGSVSGGGILRALTTTTVITLPAPAVQPASSQELQANRPSGLMSNCRWVPPTDWVCK